MRFVIVIIAIVSILFFGCASNELRDDLVREVEEQSDRKDQKDQSAGDNGQVMHDEDAIQQSADEQLERDRGGILPFIRSVPDIIRVRTDTIGRVFKAFDFGVPQRDDIYTATGIVMVVMLAVFLNRELL